MGVDCRAYIPVGTPPEDITDALAIICGAEVEKQIIDGGSGRSFPAHHMVEASYTLKMEENFWATVRLMTPLAVANSFNPSMWYPQYREGAFYWTLNERSYAFPIAVFKKLIDFFGGKVLYQDGQEQVFHESKGLVKRKANGGVPDDGRAYDRYQMQFLGLRKPTYKELAAADEESHYKEGGHGW